jgi:hypothetical protein
MSRLLKKKKDGRWAGVKSAAAEGVALRAQHVSHTHFCYATLGQSQQQQQQQQKHRHRQQPGGLRKRQWGGAAGATSVDEAREGE